MSNYFIGNISIPPHLIGIDGITRSGKFWLGDLITYFEGVEPVIHEPTLDYISIKAYYGELDKAAATELIKNIVSYKCFSSSIGRNLNFRLGDSSSVYNHPRRSELLNRVHQLRDATYEKLKPMRFEEACYPVLAHDWLSVWSVQAQALPGMKMIRVERNPIDLVYAWYETGIGRNDMAFSHRYICDGRSLPWFAKEFAREFPNQSEVDRIINSIAYLAELASPVMSASMRTSASALLVTSYERLGENPEAEVARISNFIERSPISAMSAFLQTQKAKGRSNSMLSQERAKKLEFIKTAASRKGLERLLDLTARYENFAKSIGG